ncbi:CRN1 [Nakaseomyces glabratus]|nr:CRN1 [Nakaseomyces glabratus]UCS26944.1 CRN1 [Nakaseomyces glabratus]UCS32173.1 CRN1 [Nakaseomyces glabratus]UCS37402.1 CRN1 [Nakaseomyces glabratus]
MSGKFVRASKYRHVFGQAAKKELQYENVRVTNNAWDSNLIKSNGKYLSVNWNSSGGGAFAIVPVSEPGKLPDQVPLFRGHTAQVLDTDFDPFDDNRVASSSDDGKIGIWDIPQDYSILKSGDNEEIKDIEPTKFLTGHSRKVGHILYHPTAKDVLASSSLDYTVRIWNVETGEDIYKLKHPDMVTSMSFSYDGTHLATVARDKKLRVWNVREEKVVSEGAAHAGAKNQRVVWLGNSERLATTGFSKLSDRQIGIWDAFNLEKGDLGGFYTVDQSSGILMPFYDDGNKILYLAGKGDGNIRYYEFQNDELFELSEFQSIEAQRGFAVTPKRLVNIRENEVMKCYKTVGDQRIEPVSFYVPRRSEEFQEDIYPDAPSNKPALSADEWFSGKTTEGPILVSMKSLYDGAEPELHQSHKAEATVKVVPEPAIKIEKKKAAEKPVEKEPTPEPEKPKTVGNANEVLKSDNSIDKLLQKSSDLDMTNNVEDPSKDTSGWDEEDDKPISVNVDSTASSTVDKVDVNIQKEQEPKKSEESSKVPTPVKSSTPEPVKTEMPVSKITPTKENKTMEPVRESTPVTEKASTEKESVSTPRSTSSKDEAATPGKSAKSLGLKQSVEKLSELVLKLQQTVDDLRESNLQKDDRLKALEEKIDSLLKK